jgi:hypothetical protein
MKLNSGLRILTIITATVVLSTALLCGVSWNQKTFGQTAVSPAGQGISAILPAPYVQLGSTYDDISRTIADAQGMWGSLQSRLVQLQANKPMSDADHKQLNDNINKANTIVSQWGTKKQEIASRLPNIQSSAGTTTLSTGDRIKARGDMRALEVLSQRGDAVIGDLKSTVDQISKYK